VIKIVHDGDDRPEEELCALIDSVAGYLAEREGLSSFDCEASLLFGDIKEIKQLNAVHRGIDEPTDVLSFPVIAASTGTPCDLVGGEKDKPAGSPRPVLLGDIAICREIAAKQAEEYGHSEEREIAFLFTHGLLHLIGYDHGEEMEAAEKEILEKAGIVR